jgi:hypothetical protein
MAASASAPVAPSVLAPAWIPQWALLAGQAAHGASWGLLVALGLSGALDVGFGGLAWVHMVALGYLTLISMAVLIHVLHGMLDLDWVGVRVARWSLLPFTLGAAGMVVGFWTHQTPLLAAMATVVTLSLAVYLAMAALTLARFRPNPEVRTVVVRAFGFVLAALGATAVVGLGMAWALAGFGGAWWLTVAPAIHAHLGLIGWLTLLVMGVSTHTVKPITGGKTDAAWKHVLASSAVTLGLALLLVGFTTGAGAWLWAGAMCAGLGTLAYLVDMAGILRRARVPHRPPQAFLAASSLYVVATAALGAGVLAGHADWQAAYGFLALVGWLGQMVNGHLHHIGIRVLATVARGEDDETPPRALLDARLSWSTFAAYQAAVAVGAAGLLAHQGGVVALAGALGLLAWLLMAANLTSAWRRARALPLASN